MFFHVVEMYNMKRKMKVNINLLITCILAITQFYSCGDSYIAKNYVAGYIVSKECRVRNRGDIYSLSSTSRTTKMVFGNSKGADLALFNEISKEVGDVGYNRTVEVNSLEDIKLSYNVYCSVPIASVEITSSVSIGTSYPAGSNLNDLFWCLSSSPDLYIKQRYKIDTNSVNALDSKLSEIDKRFEDIYLSTRNVQPEAVPFFKKLSDVNFKQYRLLGWGGNYFWFAPVDNTLAAGTPLTITIAFANGEVTVVPFSIQ